MPAISKSLTLVARDVSALAKRGNWASDNRGVMVVFCIIGAVVVGTGLYMAYNKFTASRERKAMAMSK